jgi:methyl halide transferase
MDTTDWNQCYAEGHTPWDRGAPSPVLEAYLTNHTIAGPALVPGCGAGHDVALLYRHGVQAYGLDLAPLALERAKNCHPHLAAATWVLGDLFDYALTHVGEYQTIIEHTCLSALPPELRPAYRAALTSLLAPGGKIVGVWFIDPELDKGETGPPYPLPLTELDALFHSDFEVITDACPSVGYAGRVGREQLRVLQRRG